MGSTYPLNGRDLSPAFEKDDNNTFVVVEFAGWSVDPVARGVDFDAEMKEEVAVVEPAAESASLSVEVGSSKRMGRNSRPCRYFHSGVVVGGMDFAY